MGERRIKLTVAYDGTSFYGWQKQHPPDESPLRTAQGVLEAAVRDVIREPVSVHGASRTDSGVHAIGQVASFDTTKETKSSARNQLRGTIEAIVSEESLVRLTVNCGFPIDALITRESKEEMKLEVSREVTLSVKATAIHLFPH